jgi:hypothetical protein
MRLELIWAEIVGATVMFPAEPSVRSPPKRIYASRIVSELAFSPVFKMIRLPLLGIGVGRMTSSI